MEAQTILPEEAYLTIVRNANGTVTLEWPVGWILQQTSSLPATPASWSDVAGATSPFTTTANASGMPATMDRCALRFSS